MLVYPSLRILHTYHEEMAYVLSEPSKALILWYFTRPTHGSIPGNGQSLYAENLKEESNRAKLKKLKKKTLKLHLATFVRDDDE